MSSPSSNDGSPGKPSGADAQAVLVAVRRPAASGQLLTIAAYEHWRRAHLLEQRAKPVIQPRRRAARCLRRPFSGWGSAFAYLVRGDDS